MIVPPCSDASLAADEPLIGSAPDAIAWVCLEQNGPWGAKAFTDSHLDAEVGRSIEAAAAEHGVRPSLVRRPGRHADPGTAEHRAVLIAYTYPGRTWLLTGTVTDPAALLDLDWAALAAGDLETTRASLPGLSVAPDPVLLVCTNGTRDTCCARLGRPIALTAAGIDPEHVWEVTHTSGHRLAATTVLLPSGVLHGRVLNGTGLLTAARRGQLTLEGYRGRSSYSPGAQVAEDHVRRTEGVLGLDDLEVVPEVDAWRVRHRDGRSWWVAVSSAESGERPESCGKESKPVKRFEARIVR
ncbi:sucrase ferredoxin [Nocardioides marmorisolisilvae]|uniref:Sucrase ferredoxin n=1 Tax=Nocardioides marmorisolisilvae TaxID=1542737 RepID=A0A3N0DVN5_9ACTN|nr:sucrase ferredoxin [Nocardioides marmorisolisilvae]RNL79621.1 sucrase ferredoxin [Nocardioides marmorisolisilvae]